MATNALTYQSHALAAGRFISDVASANNLYYVFASNHLPSSNQLVVDPIIESDSLFASTYDNMLFGKIVTPINVSRVVRKTVWTTGTIYPSYDGTVQKNQTDKYFVAVLIGSNYNVYKCLATAGNPSTVAPSGTDTSPIQSPVDGYTWKYLYTILQSDWAIFATTNYMPVSENATVKAAAVPQSVEVIKVSDTGTGYSNYVTGAFRLTDLRIGNDINYGIKDDASSTSNYYQGCIIKMMTGPAAGQYRTILNSARINSQKQITINTAFTSPPGATDQYEIYPAVTVVSTAPGSVPATARAIISSTGNTVSSVEILNTGKLHRGTTATVAYHASVNVVRQAVLVPVVSPSYGHGGNIFEELDARFTCVSVNFNLADNVLPHTNSFRSIGMIKNPVFNNVKTFITQSQLALFVASEPIIQYVPKVTLGSATASGNTITGVSTLFDNQLSIGDQVMIANSSYSDVVQVVSVSSNTVATTTPAAVAVTGTATKINVTANAVTSSVATGALTLDGVNNKLIEGGLLYGSISKGVGQIQTSNATFTAILVNDRPANQFASYIQLSSFNGSLSSGVFVQDEQVYQASTAPNAPTAKLYSISANNDVLYLSNVGGVFSAANVVVGNTSSAQFALSTKYNGDLAIDSGDIVYVENILSVDRIANKSESVKLIFEF